MEEYYNLLQHLNNSKYEMIIKLVRGKPKMGIENFSVTNGDFNNNSYLIDNVKDNYKEKRKRKNAIGTTLVNLMNSYMPLMEILGESIFSVKGFNTEKVEKFYKKVLDIIESSKIKEIPNFEKYFYEITDYETNYLLSPHDYNNELSDMELIYNYMNNTQNSELKSFCNTLYNIYQLKNDMNILAEDGNLKNNISIIATQNLSNEELDSMIIDETINSIELFVKEICYSLEHILKNNSFLIKPLIDNFIYEFHTIFKHMSNFSVYKNYVKNMALNTNNTYYVLLDNYFSKGIDEDDYEFLKDVSVIFFSSLFNDLSSLNSLGDDNYFNKINLPNVEVTMTQENSLLYNEFRYKISTLKEFIDVSSYYILADGCLLTKCSNCGRFFITDIKNSEKYCGRLDPNDPKSRPCKKIGVEKARYRITNYNTRDLYKNICNRLRNPKYNKTELETFTKLYKEYKENLSDVYKTSQTNKDFKNKKLMQWLEKYDEKLKKKYPSNRYGIKKKNNKV